MVSGIRVTGSPSMYSPPLLLLSNFYIGIIFKPLRHSIFYLLYTIFQLLNTAFYIAKVVQHLRRPFYLRA